MLCDRSFCRDSRHPSAREEIGSGCKPH
ncbi:MAG: hypothetical protein DME00_21155 [Candidatus Rokuibacteriota bacterium]|nr:MAG: hypothetical protein DME00_21155 [Candidatus Rokubacteria bacterium]PYO08055.1 MAG: hypothetical protein DMD75_19430 [Candidatus Rokubacteria bacterium]